MSPEPTTIRTLEGSVRLWPDGVELIFSGFNGGAKKKLSPVRVRLDELDHIELVPPGAVKPGALRLRLRQTTPDAGKRAQLDPHSTTFARAPSYDTIVAACRELEVRGVQVRGLPPQAPADEASAPAPAAASASRPPRRPKTSLERLYTLQMWMSGIQLFLLLIPLFVLVAVFVFVLAVLL